MSEKKSVKPLKSPPSKVKKKSRKCGICGKKGHNRATCDKLVLIWNISTFHIWV